MCLHSDSQKCELAEIRYYILRLDSRSKNTAEVTGRGRKDSDWETALLEESNG